ncbi:MAG: YXWGXW repeat-containing protein, partial [Ignavibacteriales bacterium]
QVSTTPTEIIGEVTLVGGGMLRVRDDSTQREYEFTAPPDKLSDIRTGYRVEVRAINGRALSLIRLGMPMHSESEPSQKWEVTKYPEEVNQPPLPPAPPPRMEERGIPPSRTSAWIPSHWEWNGHQWAWVSGEWMEPPNAGAIWEPSHWGWNGHQWVWISGHWRER